MVGQITGEFVTKGEKLTLYRDRALEILREFEAYQVSHIPRAENADADMLSRLVHEAPEHISKVARILEAAVSCIESLEVEPVGVT